MMDKPGLYELSDSDKDFRIYAFIPLKGKVYQIFGKYGKTDLVAFIRNKMIDFNWRKIPMSGQECEGIGQFYIKEIFK
jgi:hypothetical protein